MAAITKVTPKGPYEAVVSANELDVVFTTGTPGGDTFVAGGKDILLVRNTHATDPQTFTVTSQADPDGRLNHITAYALAAGEYACHIFSNTVGWADSSQLVHLACSSTDIKYLVLVYP